MIIKPFKILAYTLFVLMAAAVVVFMATIPATGETLAVGISGLSVTPSEFVHLPLVQYDSSPTPPPTPTNAPYSAAASLLITPFTDILASTYNTGSFVVANNSLNGERLMEMRIDLRTAIFPDMVFDPYGAAGDTVAKDVVVDLREGLGFDGHAYESPHGGGFDVLVLKFRNFDRGDQFAFSVDVDPTSITGVGAPGPFHTGSVGGLELVGATITATFDNGATLVNQAWRMADGGGGGGSHSGAVAILRPGLPQRPSLAAVGVAPPAVVGSPDQTVRVSGSFGQKVVVVVVEGGLFTDGVPGGGVDLDPFEANTALAVREYRATIGPDGVSDIPIVLSRSRPEGGINIITAVFDNQYVVMGMGAAPLVLELN